MTTIMPESDRVKNAIKWIADKRQSKESLNETRLADEASLKFDLTPSEDQFLKKFIAGEIGQ